MASRILTRPLPSAITSPPSSAAAGAAGPGVLRHEQDDGAGAFAHDIVHRGRDARGATRVGDVLRTTVRGGRLRALWVYFADRELVAACPDDEHCRQDSDGLTV